MGLGLGRRAAPRAHALEAVVLGRALTALLVRVRVRARVRARARVRVRVRVRIRVLWLRSSKSASDER